MSSLVSMKWGFASTAAIVRSIQKDFYYRKQIVDEVKLVLLDHFDVGWYLKAEEWIPLLVDLFYYGVQTGAGKRTLGQAYSKIAPIDLNSRDFLLKNRFKRLLWVLMTVFVPFLIKRKTNRETRELLDILNPLNSVLFYYAGSFPSITSRILSIRYIFYPRKPPNLDGDAIFYKGLALSVGLVTFKKLNDWLRNLKMVSRNIDKSGTITLMRPSQQNFKCPVCYDSFETTAFTSVKCGHVYCWYCIAKWMSDRAEKEESGSCPVCRVPCDPPDLLPLMNLK